MLMATGTRRLTKRTRAVASLAACALAVAFALPAPAHAEGFFEALFGGLKRAVRGATQVPREIIAPVDPMGRGQPQMLPQQAEAGRSGPAYCVRTCDGYYFPVRAAPGMSPKQMCGSLCPACETKVFYGGGAIETTVAADGTRYADMHNAYAYRQKISDTCTCNGKSPLGLAKMAIANDPTLRSGDVVVTRHDMMVFNGARGEERRFTPVKDYPGFSQRMRDSLEQIDVATAASRNAEHDKALSARAQALENEAPASPAATAAPNSSAQGALDFHQRWAIDSADIDAASTARFEPIAPHR
jgi:hypothetical protein